jgi:predicted MFS family arabinose efflux permease
MSIKARMKNATLTSSATSKPPTWLIVLAAATSAAVVTGVRQVMGLYVRPVTGDLGVTREAFGLSIAFANIVWGVTAPIFGAITDHYGSRIVIVGGLLATAAGLLTLEIATTADLLMLSGLLLGLGSAGAGIGAAVGIVARSSAPENQASAIAMIGLGSAIGIVVALPVVHLMIDDIGWKSSLSVLAIIVLAVLPLALSTKDEPAPEAKKAKPDFVTALSAACAHPTFWLINVSFLICGFHVTFFSTYLPAFVADQGLPTRIAVIALVLVGLGNLLGTYLAGRLPKVMPIRTGLSAIYIARAAIFLGFIFLPMTGATIILLSALLGLLWLSTVPLTSTLILNIYGSEWTTMLFGVAFFSHQVGAFMGGWLGGLIFDRTKSYDMLWWVSVGLGVLAALLQWRIEERPARSDQ